jgi:hypothetical protein
MLDKLLYKNIPIDVIQSKVSEATGVSIEYMLLPDRYPGSRKREYVEARQLSMTLSKKYSRYSLAIIGSHHGERDHATVLHAIKTVNNLLYTKDIEMIFNFRKSLELINDWNSKRVSVPTITDLNKIKKKLEKELNSVNKHINRIMITKIDNKSNLIKIWIKNHVPLDIRKQLLDNYSLSVIPG